MEARRESALHVLLPACPLRNDSRVMMGPSLLATLFWGQDLNPQYPCRLALGLSTVHSHPEPVVDIIFVHGLGGKSRRTWSWQYDPQKFWPLWLAEEVQLSKTRIFTFGYNADIAGQTTPSNILDFARQLLFQMKTYSGDEASGSAPIGKRPLMFVMHSMGGLVVKKAYILGKSDEQFDSIISHIHAMVFLATPHRGSAYADFLNNVLRSTPMLSGKTYVAELEKTSTSLQDINEQFRTMSQIVDRESAVLGYPSEIASGLNADHHGVCKFRGLDDPNYHVVRNLLQMLLGKLKPQDIFAIGEDPCDDFESVHERLMWGSCRWVLHRATYLDWRDLRQTGSKILSMTGLPGVGKSVLSSFIINNLEKDPAIGSCFYHFFKSEDRMKRTISHMLRSIAFQIALAHKPFGEKLIELTAAGSLSFSTQKVSSIWESVFESVLLRHRFQGPIFWIVDGLDEADHPDLFIRLLSKLQSQNIFRVLIVSRPLREIAFNSASGIHVVNDEITLNDTHDDIRTYAYEGLWAALPDKQARDSICDKVCHKAQGSFLWVTLAVGQLKDNWHIKDDIEQVLDELPDGMESLYKRMVETIASQAAKPRAIASRILTWTVCAFRPLELAELNVGLSFEFGDFVDLETTISQVCGNFVVVSEPKSKVVLVHDTARHFLLHKSVGLPIEIDYRAGHEYAAETCLKFVMDEKKKWKRTLSLFPFLAYAVTCWAYHISQSPPQSGLISLVHDFLGDFCLIWIHAVTLLDDLRAITRKAQYLRLFIRRRRAKSSHQSFESLKHSRDEELSQWSKDMIRVVGRFGNILRHDPSSIYKFIVPFCPKASMIGHAFRTASGLSVVGLSSDVWDDCLARLTMGADEFASSIICKGAYFATLIGNGVVIVWHAETCEEARRLNHGEWISVVECSRTSSLLATAGTNTIRIWDISTGEELYSIPKSTERRILSLSFGAQDEELLVGYDDASIRCIELSTLELKWSRLLEEPGDEVHLCPHLVSISPDHYHVIIGYRGKPVYAWNLDALDRGPQICTRPEDKFGKDHDSSTWKAGTPESVVWCPGHPTVLILYNDASLFEWKIEDEKQRQISGIAAREMAISQDGNLLLTSDHNGTVSVWTVPEFRLTYQLHETDMVRGLAFSPDGQRFYDIRGPLCNVWEPDVLVRPDDLDREELSSTAHETTFSEPVCSTDDTGRAEITAIAYDTEGRLFCCGKDSGAVVMYEMETGQKVHKVYGHNAVASVVEVTWSPTAKFIASADDCGRVIAKKLRKPSQSNPSWGVFPLLDFRPGDAVSQLVFSSNEEFLLVVCANWSAVWSIKKKEEICRVNSIMLDRPGHQWLNHPSKPELILCVNSEGVRIFEWESLAEVRVSPLGSIEELSESEPQVPRGNNNDDIDPLDVRLHHLTLDRAPSRQGRTSVLAIERAVPLNATQIVLEAFPNTGFTRTYISQRGIFLADISMTGEELNDMSHFKSSNLQPQRIVGQASSSLLPTNNDCQINRLVGCFRGHIVFLDQNYCFCTWDLTSTAHTSDTRLKKHFYLPKDWLSPSMLRLCVINDYGTILCPKNGEVAVIREGVKL
ncbi:hypothetical protein QBC37DRAFT_440338 [Rhypophila decipiens]|uniref:GPI inositol-deacylase n=1 Tax=Rhypophila decipiens TaxID=261697 RepID=A0AAN6YAB2_9PEZI|nr:hypothetical protein QBC37DRAFT_440338 [Rhypophila decipiens]